MSLNRERAIRVEVAAMLLASDVDLGRPGVEAFCPGVNPGFEVVGCDRLRRSTNRR